MIYMPDYPGTRNVYLEMMAVLEKSGGSIPYHRLQQGENLSFTLGGAEYRLFPSSIDFDGDNDNDMSMAAAVSCSGHTGLFAGDMEWEGIDRFLHDHEIPAGSFDILKLPHHGGEEANIGGLLALLKPGGIAVITDGQDKRAYGTLLDALDQKGFVHTCSADDGTVVISAAAQGYSVQKEKDPEILASDGWKYLLTGGSAAIAGYDGSETEIAIPAELGGYPVTSVMDSAFYNKKALKDVTIPESVTAIGASAFSWCTALEKVSIPGSVTSIGDAAFSWCTSLREITIPDSVTTIGVSGFERCGALTRVKLSNGLTKIADSLFERCAALESIEIPAGIKSIGEDAFKRCENLREILYVGTEEAWGAVKIDKDWLSKVDHEVAILYAGNR